MWDRVASARKGAPRTRVEQVLEERGIARDQEAIAGPEVGQRGQELVHVVTYRLDGGGTGQPKARVHARRPRAHRERIQRHQRPLAERIPREERDVAVGDLALAPAAAPGVGRGRRGARLIDRRARVGDAASDTALHQPIAVDVVPLVGLRQPTEDAEGEEVVRIDPRLLEEVAVRRHALGGAPRRTFRAQLPKAREEAWWGPLEKQCQPVVPEPDRLEDDVQGEQPRATAQTDQPRTGMSGHDADPSRTRLVGDLGHRWLLSLWVAVDSVRRGRRCAVTRLRWPREPAGPQGHREAGPGRTRTRTD